MAIRFHLDEHVATAIAAGLRRRGVDVTTTADAGLLNAPDEDHLAFAGGENRVIFTQDRDFLRLHALGRPHAGIAYCPQGARSVGEIVRVLALMNDCLSAGDLRGRIEFL